MGERGFDWVQLPECKGETGLQKALCRISVKLRGRILANCANHVTTRRGENGKYNWVLHGVGAGPLAPLGACWQPSCGHVGLCTGAAATGAGLKRKKIHMQKNEVGSLPHTIYKTN